MCWPSRTTSRASRPRSSASSPMHRSPASMFTAISTRAMAASRSAAVWSHPTSAGFKGDRRFPREYRFPKLTAIAMIEATVELKDRCHRERRYYIASRPFSAERFAYVVRSHWRIENSLHWVLDVIFREDLSCLRKGHGAANMAVVRQFALNLVRTVQDKRSLKVRRKLAGWDVNYLASILKPTAH